MSGTSCPLCGVYPARPPHGPSWESADTPYTDECGCTDKGSCVYHAWSLESRPPRPPEEELLARATKQYDRKVAAYQEKLTKFAEYEKLRDEVARLKDENESLRIQLAWAEDK